MHVLVSGSSGLVGSALVPYLHEKGHQVTRLVRRKPGEAEVRWYPENNVMFENLAEDVEGMVNLSGESIAEGRWNPAKKKRILESRVETTSLIAETLPNLKPMPKVWVCASAIGYYGDRGEELLDEDSAAGSGFLPDVCQQWEAATQPAADAGIRVVNLRIGVVLSKNGGALSKMLFPFKMGGGGIVGSGRQYWSCIALEDLVGVIEHCLVTESVSGPVNAVSSAVTNREFTKTLGRVLNRPTIVPLPAFAAKLALGEMAEALLLASARVVPQKLQDTGYEFKCPDLESSLRSALSG